VQPPESAPVGVTRQAYDQSATTWHTAHRDERRAVARADSYDRFVAVTRRDGLVLDLGCGSGRDGSELARRGFRLLGLDVSAGLLALARYEPALSGRLLLGEMRSLPVASGALDGVWIDGSLHHLPKSEAMHALREAEPVLSSGGSCYLSVDRGAGERFVSNTDGVVGRRWYALYEPDELATLCRAAGFTVAGRILGGPSPHSHGFIALFLRKR